MISILLDIKKELGTSFAFTETSQIGPLISRIVGILIAISAILFLIYFIWGGIRWLTSSGEKTAVAEAKQKLTAAFIGLIIVLASWAIFTLVKYMFGLSDAPPTNRVDCCQVIGGDMIEPYNCCKLVDSVGCVRNRYQSDQGQCGKLVIDWNCWASKYPYPNPDPCEVK